MPTETINRVVRLSGSGGYSQDVSMSYYHNQSSNSPKVNGKLTLVPNPHEYRRNYVSTYRYDPFGWGLRLPWEDSDSINLLGIMTGIFHDSGATWSRLQNEALARFSGKVRKHNASLGVSIASYREAGRMINDRSAKVATAFGRALDAIEKLPPRERRRRGVQGTAGAILEGQFGWAPLVSDIQAGFGALCRPPPREWVNARVRTQWNHSLGGKGPPTGHNEFKTWSAQLALTLASRVDINSENAFLLNKLGLLNMPGVAWDLVPWTWVVNLVSNAGQMVNSISEYAGVTLSNSSVTRVATVTVNHYGSTNLNPSPLGPGYFDVVTKSKMRSRGVGGFPTPTFQMRIPDFDLGLAAIAWALVAQKVSKISALVGK